MCDLCDPDTRDHGFRHLKRQADQLASLSARLGRAAAGRIEPHSDEMVRLGQDLTAVAILLLKEWA